jgi:predicted nucleotidyltransferase
MIYLTQSQLKIVIDILQNHVADCEVRVFGSRYKGTAKDYSDLDLAVIGDGKLERKLIYELKEAFEESDLPFRVDVLDFNRISKEFRVVIERGFEVLQIGSHNA